jgi:two-component system response regulator NreC
LTTIRVLLADDHGVVRGGLKLLIDAQADMSVVAEADSGRSALDNAIRHRPTVIVLDWSMPGDGAETVIPRLKRAVPDSKILVLTMHAGAAHVHAAMAAGADGYLAKSAADVALIDAIRLVSEGERYIEGGLGDNPAVAADSLSARENQVLGLLAAGHTNREIASTLDISVKSVETYRSRLRTKLGAETRAELVRAALELNIPPPLEPDDG